MKKAGLIFSSVVTSLFAMNFVSAAVSIGNFFDQIEPSTMILGALFMIFFAFINFILTKSVMKDNRPVAGVISLCISLLAVYGLYYANFDVIGLMFNFGITEDIITTWVPILLLGLAIFFSIKFHVSYVMMALGALFLILGLTNAVYESALSIFSGIALLILGVIWAAKHNKWFKKKDKLPKDMNNNSNSNFQPVDRTSDLIKEAKYFRDWAIKSGKPGFYGSWVYFLSWLNKKGWGRNEKEIVNNFGISQSEFIKIFNKYGKP
jgi:hypothetical protein